MQVHLRQYIERSGELPTTQFAYWKDLGAYDAFLCVGTLQSALGIRHEPRIEQIDLSVAFDVFNQKYTKISVT